MSVPSIYMAGSHVVGAGAGIFAVVSGGGGSAPLILYTDIVAGPKSGGENNNGIYLSIFGVNFGSVQANVSVTVGGGAVSGIIYFGVSNGRPDIQQISVQLGSAVSTGAVVVTVSGVSSNSDQTFTVATGTIYYVNNVTGSDSNAGTFALPFASLSHFQNSLNTGDFMVVEYAGTPYTTAATSVWPVKVGGTSTTTAITLMGYPGQFPYFNGQSCTKAGIYAFDGSVNSYINVCGMKIDAAGTEGAVDVEDGTAGWRVVNNELIMTTASNTNAGGIAGDGAAMFWVGNHIHDTFGDASDQTHGIYVNNSSGTYEVAYNWIENINNGSGIQTDGPQGASNTIITASCHIHHNIVHNVKKYGIELGNYGNSSGFMTDWVCWDNLVYNTTLAGFIFNTITTLAPVTAFIYNNTFYHCGGGSTGCIDIDNGSTLGASGMAITFTNNIVIPASGVAYFTQLSSSTGLPSPADKNLFSGGTGSGFGTNQITTAPSFVSPPPTGAIASGGALPDMNLSPGSSGIGVGSSACLSGNGIAGSLFLPAFTGVNTDLDLVATNAAAINVGALQ